MRARYVVDDERARAVVLHVDLEDDHLAGHDADDRVLDLEVRSGEAREHAKELLHLNEAARALLTATTAAATTAICARL